MYSSFIHQIISIILFSSFYQLVQGVNKSKSIPKSSNDHHLPIVTNNNDRETQNGSFSIIVHMIAFGIQRTDDDDKQKTLGDTDLPVRSNIKPTLTLNKDLDRSENEQTEKLQQNTRLLLLPLMIRMLLERMAERVETNKLLKIKQNNFYESIKRFITITAIANVEKTTIIVFLILTIAVFLFTTFSIIRRLRDTQKSHFVRVSSSRVNSKNHHEETKKLLP